MTCVVLLTLSLLSSSALEAAEIRARSECYVKSFSSLVDAGIENLGEEQSDRFKSDSYPSDLAHAFIGGSNSKNTITNAIEFWGDNNSHKSENSIGMTMSPSLMQILSPTATRVGCAEAVAQQTSGPLADYGSCKMVVCHYNKRNSNNNKQKKSEKSPKPKQSKETPHKKTSKKPQPHNPPVSESGPATPPQSPPPPSPKLKTNRPRRTSSPKPYPPPVFSSPEHHHDQPVVSGSHRQAALDAHNSARAQLGISPISWSSNLEASANVIAEQLSSRGCGLVHSGTLGVGENLYMYGGDLFGGQMSDGVAAWNAEGYSGASNDFNHYTQVIWRDTEQVGCARSSSSSYGSECSVTVCHYHPPGNVISQSPY